MTQKTLFSTKEAAAYLGLTVRGLKYHLYPPPPKKPALVGQEIGNSLVFTREQLDQFKKSRRPVGRPKTKDEK